MATSTTTRPANNRTTLRRKNPNPERLLIQENTVVFSVTFGYFGRSRKLDDDEYEVEADKKRTRAQKHLLECEEVQAIGAHDSKIGAFLGRRALPAPFKRGVKLLPLAVIPEVEGKMAEFAQARKRLVENLCRVYEDRVQEDRKNLGAVFNQADYPPVETLGRFYTLTWNYIQVAVPTDLPPEIAENERRKLQDLWQEAADGARYVLRANLSEMVNQLVEKVKPAEGGKRKKQIRDAFIENVNDFLQTFDKMNVTNDFEMAKLVGQCRAILKGVDTNSLKNDEVLRARIQSDFGEITTALTGMLRDVPKRRGFFQEAE